MNANQEDELLFKQETFDIIGACFEVYNQMGFGLSETVYQECLEMELSRKHISFIAQTPLHLHYKGAKLQHHFIPDLICHGSILIELKSVKTLCDEHRAQVLNYLRISQLKLGILINFGAFPKLEWERFAQSKTSHSRSFA